MTKKTIQLDEIKTYFVPCKTSDMQRLKTYFKQKRSNTTLQYVIAHILKLIEEEEVKSS
jgi:hypothetical protein